MTIQTNTGAYVKTVNGSVGTAVTAAGTGDNTLVTGYTIDRNAYSTPLSGVFAIVYNASLTSAKTLALGYTVETSDSSSFTSPWTLATATSTVKVTATGTTTYQGVLEIDVNLATAGQYIRGKFTPDLNNTATDTANITGVWVLGGTDTLPI